MAVDGRRANVDLVRRGIGDWILLGSARIAASMRRGLSRGCVLWCSGRRADLVDEGLRAWQR